MVNLTTLASDIVAEIFDETLPQDVDGALLTQLDIMSITRNTRTVRHC
jgi:hypothetical protein